jgi:hypothetical protein
MSRINAPILFQREHCTSAGRDVLWDQKSLTSYLQEQKSEEARNEKREDPGLLRRVFDKADAGFDVCLETLDGLV